VKEEGTHKTTERNGGEELRVGLVFAVLIFLLLFLIFLNARVGNVRFSTEQTIAVLLHRIGETGDSAYNIIWRIRAPRVLMAALLGGALALSGFLLQTFFDNPIAGPFVLGISSGAKMAVVLVMLLCLGRGIPVPSAGMILAAFLGALFSMGILLLIAQRVRRMSALLVAGIMIGYICSAITDFLVNFADDSEIVSIHSWSRGSFSGTSWEQVTAALVLTVLTVLFVFLLSKPIGALQLGESYARSVGVNVLRMRMLLILLSSLLSACVTAFAGPVSFVGIAVPFLVKAALGTARPILAVPAVFLGGAVFCAACDLVARLACAPMELDISTVTSLFGAPVVIFMLIFRRRGDQI
jgi:hypothetical protein